MAQDRFANGCSYCRDGRGVEFKTLRNWTRSRHTVHGTSATLDFETAGIDRDTHSGRLDVRDCLENSK